MKTISSPPRSARPPAPLSSDAPRRRLYELARSLVAQGTRQQLLEYLALRRFIRR